MFGKLDVDRSHVDVAVENAQSAHCSDIGPDGLRENKGKENNPNRLQQRLSLSEIRKEERNGGDIRFSCTERRLIDHRRNRTVMSFL
ncbi:hypothetical protein ZHAS_00007703 [Anopheles sinensis]|uniref:Uncharacterized protein n=1 Tax=Anopheles sinensis TaxID=74873 RepID=A0A084VQC0_ANOSI|nr:hypothetical protein ZHAS_00007703 [Anopheles sinensis]